MIKIDDLIGKTGILCAIEGLQFRIGDLTFEAVEDENDGYRSSLDEVKLINKNIRPTFREEVTIQSCDTGYFNGIQLVNTIGKAVLVIGTDNYEDYYPVFVFDYQPLNLTQNQPSIDELLNRVTE